MGVRERETKESERERKKGRERPEKERERNRDRKRENTRGGTSRKWQNQALQMNFESFAIFEKITQYSINALYFIPASE